MISAVTPETGLAALWRAAHRTHPHRPQRAPRRRRSPRRTGVPSGTTLAGPRALALLSRLRALVSVPPPPITVAGAGSSTPSSTPPAPPRTDPDERLVRLGRDHMDRPFLVDLDGEASVLVVGLPGSGKTTTVIRLIAEAVRLGWSAVVVDLKASGALHDAVRQIAARDGLPLFVVDRNDPDSIGYNPCTGDPAQVAGRLTGAFSYMGVSAVYGQVALATLPLVISALGAAGRPLSIRAIVDALEPGGLALLGREAGVRDGVDHAARLRALQQNAEKTRVLQEGLVGLQQRLKALDVGLFGELLRRTPALDWADVDRVPSLVYLGLSTLGAPADVELLGRVIAQDLKGVADARLRSRAARRPWILILDEFAALGEAEQLVDLVLQGREAGIITVASTQFLPRSTPVRKALLGSGVVVAHRVEGDDAETLAAQFGTSATVDVTPTVDFATGEATRGALRRGRTYTISPDQLRELDTGEAAVRVVRRPLSTRHTIITVSRERLDP